MHVEGLGLDTGRVHGLPFQVLLAQLSVWRFVGLLRHGLDGVGAIDGLLGTGYMSKSGLSVLVLDAWEDVAYCCCVHLSMVTDGGMFLSGESRRSAGG